MLARRPLFLILFSFIALLIFVSPAIGADDDTPLAAVSSVPDTAERGPYGAGDGNLSIPGSSGTPFRAFVYYPATADGLGAPYDPSGGPYPLVIFGHGFISPAGIYNYTYEHLASWGYIVVVPRIAGELFPSHPFFADGMSDAISYIEAENANPGSPFYQQVDMDKVGISGHSMGGGVAFLAAEQDPRVDTIFTWAAANTWPDSAVDAAGTLSIPVGLMVGTRDTIAPANRHSTRMYDNASDRRLIAYIQGGDHCAFIPALPPCGNTIGSDVQIDIAHRWLVAWMELYLKDDTRFSRVTWGHTTNDDPNVVIESDAEFTFTAARDTITVRGGSTVVTIVKVTNTGTAPTRYNVRSASSFPAAIIPFSALPVQPGGFNKWEVGFAAPNVTQPTTETVTLVARSVDENLTTQTVELTVNIVP